MTERHSVVYVAHRPLWDMSILYCDSVTNDRPIVECHRLSITIRNGDVQRPNRVVITPAQKITEPQIIEHFCRATSKLDRLFVQLCRHCVR